MAESDGSAEGELVGVIVGWRVFLPSMSSMTKKCGGVVKFPS
jgi:hypothetical protein